MHLSFVTISFLPRDMPEGNFKGLPWRGLARAAGGPDQWKCL